MSGAWSHIGNSNNYSQEANYWDSLKHIHRFVYFLAYVELILKALLAYYLFTDYKGKYNWKGLLNLNYTGESPGMDGHTPEIKSDNNFIPAGGVGDASFHDEY